MSLKSLVARPLGASVSSRLLGVALVAGLSLAGCGPGGAPDGWGESEHSDISIGSSAIDGGRLVIDYDFTEAIALPFTQCIGGSGADCAGGIALYSSEDPGWGPIETDLPEEGIYPLAEGVSIRLEVTAIDGGASYFVNGTTLNRTGDLASLGTAVEGLHAHGEWQIAVPGGTAPAVSYQIGLRAVAPNGEYEPSMPVTVTLSAGAE